jgi:hypothetical protein
MADNISPASKEIFGMFIKGKHQLADGECEDVTYIALTIGDYMAIPLVQGVICAAYTLDYGDGDEEQLGFGTLFAAAISHIGHACNPEDAALIQENMTFVTNSPYFAAVKTHLKVTMNV